MALIGAHSEFGTTGIKVSKIGMLNSSVTF